MDTHKKKPVVALHASHPSQIWILKAVAEEISKFARVSWYIRDKDITKRLADEFGLSYKLVSKAGTGLVKNAFELFTSLFWSYSETKQNSIDLWVTKYSSPHIISTLLRKPSIAFNDDDAEIIPLLAWTCFPFTTSVLVPDVVSMGRFEKKAISFPSCFELCYLHPKRFHPDPSILEKHGISTQERFAVIRLSALQAHHDVGVSGVTKAHLRALLSLAKTHNVKIFITSEKPLEDEFEPYRLALPPTAIHHLLAFAEFLFGDSQTMTTESALLGTPAFRVSSLVGKLSAIALLEDYGLCHGFLPEHADQALAQLKTYLETENPKATYKKRLEKMLQERVDPLPVFVETIQKALAG